MNSAESKGRGSHAASSSKLSSVASALPTVSTPSPQKEINQKPSLVSGDIPSFYDEALANIVGEAPEDAESEEACPDEVVSISSAGHAKPADFKQYESTADFALVRLFPDGTKIMATMIPGQKGFAKASFPGSETEYETEIPNATLLLHQGGKKAVQKAKAKAGIKRPASSVDLESASMSMKRPAASQGLPEKNAAPSDSNESKGSHLQAANEKFGVMVYPDGSWAIRKKSGDKKQLFSVPSKNRSFQAML